MMVLDRRMLTHLLVDWLWYCGDKSWWENGSRECLVFAGGILAPSFVAAFECDLCWWGMDL